MENIVLIGCGAIASTHIQAILANNKNLIAICDIVEEKAINLKNIFNLDAKIYTNYITMFNELNIDVVHICTPHYLHKEMVIEALRRNINVLCEKPLCISLDEITEIKEQLCNTSAQLGVCYQNRYNETTIKAKELCQKFNFNSGSAFLEWCRKDEYYLNSLWRGKWATEGGSLLINQSIHTIDLMCYLLGEPTELTATCRNFKHQGIIETEDSAKIHFEGNGFSFDFVGTTTADKDYPNIIELFSGDNELIITPNSISINGVNDIHSMEEISFAKTVWGDGHKKLIKDFYECIESSRPFSIGFDEAIISLKAVLAAYRSNSNKVKI